MDAAHKMGKTFTVGYTSYSVWRAWWSNRLSDNRFLDEPPNAAYLFIDLSVRNNDKKARTIPSFELVDHRGAEYEQESSATTLDGAIGLFDSLNPGVSKQGFIVFDVPRQDTYRLKVSGGYWSGRDALVEIIPAG